MNRKVLHVDCDCFFAAVEMRDRPELQNIPLAVGGSSDRRGVISTCNYPARAFGVRSAMATAHALKLCPDLLLMPGNMEKYKTASRQVMEVLQPYAVDFQQVSVDEAYLELPETCNALEIAQQIQQRVLYEVGISVSVGIAPNKFLAKIASDWNKPNGLFAIASDDIQAFVSALPVGKIPGVGPKSVERLKRYGIETCSDLQKHDHKFLLDRFGQFGEILYQRSRGRDDRTVAQKRARKSISVERTFAEDLSQEDDIDAVVLNLWSRLAKRIQQHHLHTSAMTPFVKVKFSDFQVTTLADHHKTVSLNDFTYLIHQAMLRQNKPIRLLGIGGRLPQLDGGQLPLF